MRNSDNGVSDAGGKGQWKRVYTASCVEQLGDELRLTVIIYGGDSTEEQGIVQLTMPADDPVPRGIGLTCVAVKAVVTRLQEWSDRPIDIGECLASVTEAGESEPAKE